MVFENLKNLLRFSCKYFKNLCYFLGILYGDFGRKNRAVEAIQPSITKLLSKVNDLMSTPGLQMPLFRSLVSAQNRLLSTSAQLVTTLFDCNVRALFSFMSNPIVTFYLRTHIILVQLFYVNNFDLRNEGRGASMVFH